MTPFQSELHRAHKARHHSWNARAVPDDGIDLKRGKIVSLQIAPVEGPPPSHRWLVEFAPGVLVAPADPATLPKNRGDIRGRFTVRKIIKRVAADHGTPVAEIMSDLRLKSVVRSRHIAMYLARIITLQSLPWIGRQFGGKDHSSVLHAVRKVQRCILADAQFAAEIAALECIIRGQNP